MMSLSQKTPALHRKLIPKIRIEVQTELEQEIGHNDCSRSSIKPQMIAYIHVGVS
jgi:hypothetical protein